MHYNAIKRLKASKTIIDSNSNDAAMSYRVFLGAPSLNTIDNDPLEYQWESISSHSQSDAIREQFPTPPDFPTIETLDDASQRVSLVYQNIIFNDDDDDDDDDSWEQGDQSEEIDRGQVGVGMGLASMMCSFLTKLCNLKIKLH